MQRSHAPLRSLHPPSHAPVELGHTVHPEALVLRLADRPYPVMTSYLGTTLVASDPVEVVTGPAVWRVLDLLPARPVGPPVPLGVWLGYLGYALGTRDAPAAAGDGARGPRRRRCCAGMGPSPRSVRTGAAGSMDAVPGPVGWPSTLRRRAPCPRFRPHAGPRSR